VRKAGSLDPFIRRTAGTPASARPTRSARAATKRGYRRDAPPWRKGRLLRSGGIIAPEGPSASWHLSVHPADALGARRYEERDSERQRSWGRPCGHVSRCMSSRPAPGWHWTGCPPSRGWLRTGNADSANGARWGEAM